MWKKREGSKVASHHFYEDQMHQQFLDSTDPFMGDTSDAESTETEEEEEIDVKTRGRPRKQVDFKKNVPMTNYFNKKRRKNCVEGHKKPKKMKSKDFGKLNSNEKKKKGEGTKCILISITSHIFSHLF